MCAHTAIVDVDPELLQARIQAVDDPVARRWATSVSEYALKALVRLHEIDFPALERGIARKSATELWKEANEPVAAMWLELEELRQLMAPLVQAYEAIHGDDSIIGSITDDDAPASDEAAAIELDSITGRIAETAWAMTFVVAGEVESFRRRLNEVLKLPEAWELAGALQDHAERVRSAVDAVLSGVYASLPPTGAEEDDEESVEVLVARELRGRVFDLRDAVLDIERRLKGSPPAQWQDLLSEALGRIETFIFGPGFAWMRAPDKRTFMGQRHTLTEILMMYSPLRAGPARQTIEDLARFLEAMEMLNQRECLVVHDRGCIASVVEHMERALASEQPETREHIGAALAALSEAQGRDRLLDVLLAQTLEPGTPVPVDGILERAREILKQLGG